MTEGECAVLTGVAEAGVTTIAVARSPEERQRIYRFRYAIYVD